MYQLKYAYFSGILGNLHKGSAHLDCVLNAILESPRLQFVSPASVRFTTNS